MLTFASLVKISHIGTSRVSSKRIVLKYNSLNHQPEDLYKYRRLSVKRDAIYSRELFRAAA